ncbi:MAG: NAD-binding protein [Fimbriiglobus sp.]
MAKPLPPPRIAVLGAGPIGLEAALYAKSLNLPVTVFERGQIADYVQKWGFVRMFSPFGMNATALGKHALLRDTPTRTLPADTDLLTGRELRDGYLVPVAESSAIRDCMKVGTSVLVVGRVGWRKTDPADPKKPLPPFRLLVREGNAAERFETADAVLDCTGTYSRPNWVGDGGIPAAGEMSARQHMTCWLEDVLGPKRQAYAGRTVAVIGGGYSAATTVCELAALAEQEQATWVVWLTHGPRSQPLPRVAGDPLRERDRLAAKANSLAMRCDGNLEYHPQTRIEELHCHGPDQGFRITGKVAGRVTTWDVDRVIANVGYRPDPALTTELRLGEPAGGGIETAEPGYFVLGSKSFGRDSSFLLRDGHEQIRRAFAVILAKPSLDQYAKKAA